MSIGEMLKKGAPIEEIGGMLDRLDHGGRLVELFQLSGSDQAALYERATGKGCSIENFVPALRPPLEEVIHWGKNSLPAFTRFQKRFCRPTVPQQPAVAWGYNEGVTRPFIGPGYFVAREKEHENGVPTVVIDYYSVPTEKPEDWPAIRSNDSGLSSLVYGQMHDWMWRVSAHMTVGRANKKGTWTNNYFVLCRGRA